MMKLRERGINPRNRGFNPYLDKMMQEKYDAELVEFGKAAKSYNELNEKPTMPEDQRKYIVQADSKNREKEYQEALDLYEKAIQINPTSYPSAYNNMALLAAQIKNYRYAIFNMKKYLLLVPAAEDARAAQDKIYEWEAEVKK
jgi:tetratricopeptide (TPR) repeat protein